MRENQIEGGGIDKVSQEHFFASMNSDFNAFGRKKYNLRSGFRL